MRARERRDPCLIPNQHGLVHLAHDLAQVAHATAALMKALMWLKAISLVRRDFVCRAVYIVSPDVNLSHNKQQPPLFTPQDQEGRRYFQHV